MKHLHLLLGLNRHGILLLLLDLGGHLIHSRVHIVYLFAVVAELVCVCLSLDIFVHLSFEVLDDGLGLTDVSSTGHGRTFLDSIVAKHIVVCFFLELVSFSAHLLLL